MNMPIQGQLMNMIMRVMVVVLSMLILAACETNAGDTYLQQKADAAVFGHTWHVRSIGDKPAKKGANGYPLSLVLDADNNKVSGFTGCNNYFAVFTHEQNQMSMGALAMTRKYCNKHAEQETRFTRALQNVAGYRVVDGHLLLLDEQMKIIITLAKGR